MVYYDRVETHWPVRVQFEVGSRVPLHSTASGKMYLSSLPPSRREYWLDLIELKACTPNTIVDRAELERELINIAECGYSTDHEEYIEGMVAIAVPMKDSEGRLYATLSVQAPCMRVPYESLTELLPAIQAASLDLSKIIQKLP